MVALRTEDMAKKIEEQDESSGRRDNIRRWVLQVPAEQLAVCSKLPVMQTNWVGTRDPSVPPHTIGNRHLEFHLDF